MMKIRNDFIDSFLFEFEMFADVFGTFHYSRDICKKRDEKFKCLCSFIENKQDLDLEKSLSANCGMHLGMATIAVANLAGSSFLIYPVELCYNFIYNKIKKAGI